MDLRDVSLDDKYADTGKPALISGPQAVVRLLLTQRRRDVAAGLNTAGFVSGYRGSPLGYVDQTLWEAGKWLDENRIVFQPGINEDLAATAIWGTQQIGIAKDATVDGVFGLWYGKGPGVDRSGDPLKHGNVTGCHPRGGVLVLLGDDHPGKSSTVAHHSEQAMVAHQMPVIYPAGVAEFVKFGLMGWALSRYAGCWTALKCVNETIEQTATVPGEENLQIATPPYGDLPPEGLHYRGVYAPARDEMIHKRWRIPLVKKFWRANRMDRSEFGVERPKLGIVTAGKAYGDVMQALNHLGIDGTRARQLGVDVYKVGMIWPLEPEGLREFAQGCGELFFVEEKSAFMEPQAAAIFYNDEHRPRITGKTDEAGESLLPSDLLLEPIPVALAIGGRLKRSGLADDDIERRLAAAESTRQALQPVPDASPKRLPFFCSGCPHNTSTNVPDGSLAIAGIGCHGMAMWAKPGTTLLGTQMGGEGVTWAAMQHFVSRGHIFQNIGDGTYYHSGLLAIRQAIASRANITYKILFNDAIAMTGGQPVEGPLSPDLIAQQVLAEGARRVVVVAEDPSVFDGGSLPAEVPVRPREDLDAVQRELRDVAGCTVLIYVQTCAAEKRRRRKRRLLADPPVRMIINDAVCEGCGDCSAQSGCVSIEPFETPLGRKRRINQSSCNKDYSCAKGFCPSFVTVEGVQMRRRGRATIDEAVFAALPRPPATSVAPPGTGVMLAGIGGTGVVTVGAVLSMAAHMQGLQASVYDMTGMSQKNGAVLSHLRITDGSTPISTQTVGLGEARLVIAFDLVAALSDEAFRTMSPETRVLANDRVQITPAFNFNPDEKIDTGFISRKIRARVGDGNVAHVDATGTATALCGDAIGTNFFMVGIALQKCWLPLELEAVERAVTLNGVQVDFNLNAIRLGRLWAHDPATIDGLLRDNGYVPVAAPPPTLEDLVSDRAARLTDYQNAAYSARYLETLRKVRDAESRMTPGRTELSDAAARALYRLMAYKDEYEVARLHADPAFAASIAAQFEGTPKLRFHLAPPLFAKRDPVTGHLVKQQFGAWMLPAFRLLARLRFLRGTAFDIFGRTAERRMERGLVERYEALLADIARDLRPDNHAAAVALASAALDIRGFGHVKEASVERVRRAEESLRAEFATPPHGKAPRAVTEGRPARATA
ncbi:MAG: indolepyruvate ferredoxin oxidoreductase family protein [Betaproteobacteria bacterium]|nr:indolepyruvate ferredoxin oxidoreductase family protein [Betaproteobacteria bacterium]